jgi:hypothetical protein
VVHELIRGVFVYNPTTRPLDRKCVGESEFDRFKPTYEAMLKSPKFYCSFAEHQRWDK